MSFETVLFSQLNNLRAYLRAQPLNLGGVTATMSGGAGGPPGGFVGYLPQTRVGYDTTEAEVTDSGTSLLNNLNRIRYRVAELEDYHHVYSEEVTVVSDTTEFPTNSIYVSGTLRLYYNGLRQQASLFSEDIGYDGFTTTFTVASGEVVIFDYDYKDSDQ